MYMYMLTMSVRVELPILLSFHTVFHSFVRTLYVSNHRQAGCVVGQTGPLLTTIVNLTSEMFFDFQVGWFRLIWFLDLFRVSCMPDLVRMYVRIIVVQY